MKREILFRAQLLYSKELVEGDLIKFTDGILIRQQGKPNLTFPIISKVIPDTVCQFTGLTDKNGTKAFDKDLIKAPSGRIYVIIWATWVHDEKRNKFLTDRYEFTGWCISKDGINPCDLLDSETLSGEIIGNILDNPELLK